MADVPKAAFESCLTCWDRTAKYRKYIRSLKDNLAALESKMDELGRVYNDVNRLVETAEEGRWIRKDDTGGWLERVEAHSKEAKKILADGKQMMGNNCQCGICITNCRARYMQSKLAEAKKAVVETELVQGRAFRVKEDVVYEPADLIFERTLEDLRRRSDELRDVFETVKQRVKGEEEQHMVRTPEVGGWLKRVEYLLEKHVRAILKEGELEMKKSRQRVQAGDSWSQRNFSSYRQLFKHALDKSAILEEELGKGRGFAIFTYKPDAPFMVEIPLEEPVGLDSIFENVWQWVQDEDVRCIGLYGMGGVGKTTLLKKIYNEFLKVKHDYDFVAWIVVSRPANPERIQQVIWRNLKLPEFEWGRTSSMDRAGRILNIMKQKRFLLFLDDMWEEIDLLNLGIPPHSHQDKSKIILITQTEEEEEEPPPSDKSKIIFTTRSEEVCGLMRADRMKRVSCLPPDKSMELFREKVGDETWFAHVEIPKLAKSLVEECDNLPLALITVGATMSTRKHPAEWRHAIEVLRNRPAKFKGMEEKVLSVLEFSYEALPDEAHKTCFSYCSLFPEDYVFRADELIDLWIGEGFLDEGIDIHEARGWGVDIINTLVRASLLESSPKGGMRMHDIVRDMALWVASEHGKKKNKILVQDSRRSFNPNEVKKWYDAEKVSLWNVDQTIDPDLPAMLSCSRLSTLIIRKTMVRTFPFGFFSSLPSLTVLDLSWNDYLEELPKDIGALTNLRYLNLLANKRLEKLQVNMKNLAQLVILLVERECSVPVGLISGLSSLRVFVWGRSTSFGGNGVDEHHLTEELRDIKGLEEVSPLTLTSPKTCQRLLMSGPHTLQRCLTELALFKCWGLSSLIIPKQSMSQMEHLRSLHIYECELVEVSIEDGGNEYILRPPSLEEDNNCFRSLTEIHITGCFQLRDVTRLIYHAPSLTRLFILRCRSMREVIVGDVDGPYVDRIFSCLSQLVLEDLPNLESICRRALPFPSLNRLEVRRCPNLRKLPLDNSSGRSSLQIERS